MASVTSDDVIGSLRPNVFADELHERAPRGSHHAPGPTAVLVGARIKSGRQEAGLSQTVLAEAAGVSFQQLQKYERGVNRVSADRLQRIAKALDKPITFFFSKDDIEVPDIENAARDVFAWMKSSASGRRLVARVPKLSDADAELIAALVERLIGDR